MVLLSCVTTPESFLTDTFITLPPGSLTVAQNVVPYYDLSHKHNPLPPGALTDAVSSALKRADVLLVSWQYLALPGFPASRFSTVVQYVNPDAAALQQQYTALLEQMLSSCPTATWYGHWT